MVEVPLQTDHDELVARVAALEAAGGTPPASQSQLFESSALLTNQLYIQNGAPFEAVVEVTTGPVAKDGLIHLVGRSHGDPRQDAGQEECAWVTGIAVYDQNDVRIGRVLEYGGCDLEYARKFQRDETTWYKSQWNQSSMRFVYEMRAVNLTEGGHFNISWAYLGALVL